MNKDPMPMAWNESNGGNNRDPWGRRPSNSNNGPPNIDEIIVKLQKKLKDFFNGNNNGGNNSTDGSGGKFGYFGMISLIVIIALLYLASGFYIVKPAQKAVVTRFGKYNRTVEQGPHWLPRFIEDKRVVNTEKISSSRHSGSMLTEDENIVTVTIEVQYLIGDLEKYLFRVASPDLTLRLVADSALRQVIGNSKLDYIMTGGRADIADNIRKQMSLMLEAYQSGIYVVTVAFREAKAPDQVKDAFDNVIKAREERERLKHQAEGFANKIIPEAKGTAERMRVEAKAYKQETILAAVGETTRFNQVLPEYQLAPKVTKTRLYIDTIEKVLTNTSKVLIDIDSNNLVYLPLDHLKNNKFKKLANKNKSVGELSKEITNKVASKELGNINGLESNRRNRG